MPTRLCHFIAATLIAATSAANAEVFILDDFDTTTAAAAQGVGSSASGSSPDEFILGGERDIAVNVTGGLGALSARTNFYDQGEFEYAANAGVAGMAVLTYDGVDGEALLDPTGLGGFDLTVDGQHAFQLADVFADHLAGFTIVVYDASDPTGNTWSSGTLTLTSPLTTLATLTLEFADFNEFGTGGAADFSNVGAIELRVYDIGEDSLDVSIGAFQVTAPEPGAVALVGCGLLGMWWMRRRS